MFPITSHTAAYIGWHSPLAWDAQDLKYKMFKFFLLKIVMAREYVCSIVRSASDPRSEQINRIRAPAFDLIIFLPYARSRLPFLNSTQWNRRPQHLSQRRSLFFPLPPVSPHLLDDIHLTALLATV